MAQFVDKNLQIEIKAIIKERSRFEYALARRVTKKIDYLRYIKYEKALEKLRAQRTIRLSNEIEIKECKYTHISLRDQRQTYTLRLGWKTAHSVTL